MDGWKEGECQTVCLFLAVGSLGLRPHLLSGPALVPTGGGEVEEGPKSVVFAESKGDLTARNPALSLSVRHHHSTSQTARATVCILGGEVLPSGRLQLSLHVLYPPGGGAQPGHRGALAAIHLACFLGNQEVELAGI